MKRVWKKRKLIFITFSVISFQVVLRKSTHWASNSRERTGYKCVSLLTKLSSITNYLLSVLIIQLLSCQITVQRTRQMWKIKVSFTEENHLLILGKRLNWIETTLSVISRRRDYLKCIRFNHEIRIGVQLYVNIEEFKLDFKLLFALLLLLIILKGTKLSCSSCSFIY